MSEYTDSRSKPGAKGAAGTDDRQLFLTEAGGMVITAYDEANEYAEMSYEKAIAGAKADTFPIIGRKRDATEHVPGELILGGSIVSDEITITVDNILVDAVFIAEIDKLLSYYAFSEPYMKQIGQSLGTTNSRRIAIMHILASRETTGLADQPTPAYIYAADMLTNGASLETAAQKARQYLLENDMSGEKPAFMLPWAQYLILSKFTGIEGGPVTTGSGNRSTGEVGLVMGLKPKGTNHIPKTNITAGLAKYRGDFSTTVGHIGSKMAVGTLTARGLKMVMKDQDDRLGTLIIGSMLNGHGKLRPECSIEVRTDAIGGRAAL